MPIVSVIIPAYNQASYLRHAIQSVLDQTFPDFELVVVDDGSTDETQQVLSLFLDPRLYIIKQPNAGLSAARNTGIRNSSAPFISFLDSDDLFLPEKLSILHEFLKNRPEVGLVAGEAIFIDEAGHQLEKKVHAKGLEGGAELLLGNPIHVGSILVHRGWLDRVGSFDVSLRACEDWDMLLRLAMAGCIMCSVSIPVSLYRVHKGQMTQQSERMRTAMLSVLDKVYLTENLPESWRALHDKAYAAAYVKAAARAYHACEYIYAKKDLAEAVRLDPSLIENDGRILSEILSGWSDAPMGEEPLAYLEAVYKNFPDGFLSAHHYRRYFALKSIQLAFEAYQQNDLNNTRSYVLRAIQYQPEWLKNRGVLAILFRSLFHL